MSLSHPSIVPHSPPRAALIANYFTVFVDTNISGYNAAVRRAVWAINSKSTDWADSALLAMDQGWAWGARWTDERWRCEIVRGDVFAGIYRIRILTEHPHSWIVLARLLKNEINKRQLYLGNYYRRQYVRRITALPPPIWGDEAIQAFNVQTIRKRYRPRRRGTN